MKNAPSNDLSNAIGRRRFLTLASLAPAGAFIYTGQALGAPAAGAAIPGDTTRGRTVTVRMACDGDYSTQVTEARLDRVTADRRAAVVQDPPRRFDRPIND